LRCPAKCIHFCRLRKRFGRRRDRCDAADARAPKPLERARAQRKDEDMGNLTTHVLDTAHGCPAAGMHVALFRVEGGMPRRLKSADLDRDGRFPGVLLDGAEFTAGRYRLVFEVAAYFRQRGAALPEPPFLETVPIDFGIAAPGEHYHVPLLVSPWSYSTYRGS
jgi:5-hydroxyisourate hydrolase